MALRAHPDRSRPSCPSRRRDGGARLRRRGRDSRQRLPRRLPRRLAVGSTPSRYRGQLVTFHTGVAYVAQVALFIVLGLLVFPSRPPRRRAVGARRDGGAHPRRAAGRGVGVGGAATALHDPRARAARLGRPPRRRADRAGDVRALLAPLERGHDLQRRLLRRPRLRRPAGDDPRVGRAAAGAARDPACRGAAPSRSRGHGARSTSPSSPWLPVTRSRVGGAGARPPREALVAVVVRGEHAILRAAARGSSRRPAVRARPGPARGPRSRTSSPAGAPRKESRRARPRRTRRDRSHVPGRGERRRHVGCGTARSRRRLRRRRRPGGARRLGAASLPGGIDPHVHFDEPGGPTGRVSTRESRALAASGFTTFVDMPLNSVPATTTPPASTRSSRGAGAPHVDFALWGGLVPGRVDQLEVLAERGVLGFKAFMCNSGVDEFHGSTTRASARHGARRRARIDRPAPRREPRDRRRARRGGRGGGRVSARDFTASRPVVAELEAIDRLFFAGETGAPAYRPRQHADAASRWWRRRAATASTSPARPARTTCS